MKIGQLEIELIASVARIEKDMAAAGRIVSSASNGMVHAANVAKNALSSIGVGLSFTAIASQLGGAQRRFDVLNSSLITATGSVSNAASAFKALSSFASSTPYGLAEVTQAFVKMRNMGLDPSEAALRSYGNTAAAMGKGLNQMVEAVADAATGEFERLKEFGIKAKQNGDQVALTFQGVTTTIGNNARDIEAYLQKLGNTDFAGGMELRANTLDGAIANLGDTWEATMLKLSQTGGGDLARESVIGITGALTDLTAILDSASAAAEGEGNSVREMGLIHRGLTTVFEALAVLGANVAYTFTQVGKELGGLAAQAVAVMSGDFAGARRIGEMMRAEAAQARKDIDGRTAAILGASAKAQKAMVDEATARKTTGADALAQFRIEQAAATETAEAAKKRIAAAKKTAEEYAASVKAAEGFIQAMKTEGSQLGLNAGQLRMMNSAREAAKAPTLALRMQIMGEALALDIATEAWEAKTHAEKLSAEATDLSNTGLNEIHEQTAALILKVKTYGMLPEAITAVQIAELEAAKQSLVLTDAGVADIQRRIDALKGLAAAQTADTAQDKGLDVTKAKELLDILAAVDAATKSAAAGMAASFGRVGAAIGGLTTALSGYAVQQQAITAQLAASKGDPKNGPEKIAKLEVAAAQASAQAKVRSYGDMASAAKGFFKENTTGYKVMEGAEKAFRAAEMAMAIETMLTKSGLTTAFTGLFVASKATEVAAETTKTGVSTALAGTEASAWGITAVVKALASLPFPANLAAGAATLAAVVAIGAKLFGGISGGGSGGGMAAADAQKTQGTGGVFGDTGAKTESIMRSLEMLESHSDALLPINRGMLSALRNIEASMSGLTNLLIRTPGIVDGTNMGIAEGSTSNPAIRGFLGKLNDIEPISRFLNNLWGKTKTNIVDSGVQFGGSVNDLQSGLGYSQYASVDTTKSSWFGLKKKTSNSVETQVLSAELSTQFGLIFTNLEGALTSAAVGMGMGAAQVVNVLDKLVIDTTSISLKGLAGQDLTDALNGVISKTMDEMAVAVFPEMDKFRQVGEGYAETVIRIAANYATLDAALNSIGMTFGPVGTSSLAAREHLIMLSGGIDKFSEQTAGFAENYLTEAERLAPVQKYVTESLAALGYLGDTALLTRDDFKAAVLGLQDGGALATEAGAATFAALMALQGAFAMVVPAAEDATLAIETQAQALERVRNAASALLGGVDDAFSVLQRVTQRSMNTLSERIAKEKALSNAIRSTLDNMVMPGNELADRARAQAQLRSALDIAKAGGPLPSADAFAKPLSVLGQNSSVLFETYQDYQRDFYTTQNEIAALGTLADDALAVDEKKLTALEEMLRSTQTEIDILKGIDTNGLSILQALEAVRTAILSAKENALVGSAGAINSTYQSALGRVPDAAGMQFFQDQVANGTSIDSVVNAIKNSPEAKAQGLYQSLLGRPGDAAGIAYWSKALGGGMSVDSAKDLFRQSNEYKTIFGIPGFASGGDHSGGLRIVGENGPELEMTGPSRILSHGNLMAALRTPVDNNAVLVSAVERLTAENAAMRKELNDALYAVARNTRVSADYHDKADTIGTPPVRVDA